ncbi:hypothetical protein B0H14DRAFT_3452659 [Mycena olivaceomarginata]|nr:hypothetical protein B0H14DRAFT_3452659 [Mycena olivaceomarginata]
MSRPKDDHLTPYTHPILSDAFPDWFMGLRDNIEIMRSANAHGRSDDANSALDSGDNAQWDDGCFAQTAHSGSHEVKEILVCARLIHCRRCDLSGLASNNRSSHDCSAGQDKITEKNFPDLECMLYVHIPHRASSILGDLASILTELKLIADVAAILAAPSCELNVYAAEDQRDDDGLLLTMAVDILLTRQSRCPASDGCKEPPQVNLATGYDVVTGPGFRDVKTILDLPPHYPRHLWYKLRIGAQWPLRKPKNRLTKKQKKF